MAEAKNSPQGSPQDFPQGSPSSESLGMFANSLQGTPSSEPMGASASSVSPEVLDWRNAEKAHPAAMPGTSFPASTGTGAPGSTPPLSTPPAYPPPSPFEQAPKSGLRVPLLIWSLVLIVGGLIVILFSLFPTISPSMLFIGMLVMLGVTLIVAALTTAKNNK